jgi:hypothetical protein
MKPKRVRQRYVTSWQGASRGQAGAVNCELFSIFQSSTPALKKPLKSHAREIFDIDSS